MFTDWANFWGSFAGMNVATVTTLPNGDAVLLEDDALIEISEQL